MLPMLPRNPAAMADAFCDAPNIFDSINKARRNVEDKTKENQMSHEEDLKAALDHMVLDNLGIVVSSFDDADRVFKDHRHFASSEFRYYHADFISSWIYREQQSGALNSQSLQLQEDNISTYFHH